jgi:hypothetical protein
MGRPTVAPNKAMASTVALLVPQNLVRIARNGSSDYLGHQIYWTNMRSQLGRYFRALMGVPFSAFQHLAFPGSISDVGLDVRCSPFFL